MDKNKEMLLINTAIEAREKSYSPYSHFAVGAALLTKTGNIYSGANIESAAFAPSVCAERVAFYNAISNGERDFVAIAVIGAMHGKTSSRPCPPCGVCRQVMAEFCDGNFEIILFDGDAVSKFKLSELLPNSFGGDEFSL